MSFCLKSECGWFVGLNGSTMPVGMTLLAGYLS